MTQAGLLLKSRAALDRLVAVLARELESGDVGLDQILTEYLDMRRELACDMAEFAGNELDLTESSLLDRTLVDVEHRMRERFSGAVSDKLLKPRGYGHVHKVLLEYLDRRLGLPVPSSILRVLSGDQVHTERRVRELREFGFDITWKTVGGELTYTLNSEEVDLNRVAARQLELRIKPS